MRKIIEIILSGFESNQYETNIDKKKLQKVARMLNAQLKKIGAVTSKLKVNHVDISGFVQFPNQLITVSLSNVGWNECRDVMIRTAEHEKDYTGGMNNWLPLNEDLMIGIKNFTS